MATRASRPTRTLLIFGIVIAVMYVAVFALGTFKPKLGLDLQGGTRITLQAQAVGGTVTSDKLSQAVDIISQRVNGAGVANAEVTTQGSDIVTVSIPGHVSNDLANTIGETAQLRFRIVAQAYPAINVPSTPTTPTPTSPTGSTSPHVAVDAGRLHPAALDADQGQREAACAADVAEQEPRGAPAEQQPQGGRSHQHRLPVGRDHVAHHVATTPTAPRRRRRRPPRCPRPRRAPATRSVRRRRSSPPPC